MEANVTPMYSKGDEEELPDSITCDALRMMEAKEEKPIVLDVRSEEKWNEGHIEWATHLPLDKIAEEAEQLLPNKNELIIACCAVGGSSPEAVKILKEKGYTNVKSLSGGYSGYCGEDEEIKDETEAEG